MKEKFESWIRTRSSAPLAYNAVDDLYLNPHVQARYESWKASRVALMKDYVPMPRQCPSWLEDTYDAVVCPDTNYIGGLCLPAYEAMLKAQEEALRQAGIEVVK